jgi:cell division protein FtsL
LIKRKFLITAVMFIIIIAVYVIYDYTHMDDCNHPNMKVENSIVLYNDNPLAGSQASENTTPWKTADTPQVLKGYYIYINLDNCMMYVYKNGELIKIYPVSGGKTATPSPFGTWKIAVKEDWGEGFGGAWMGLSVPWGIYGMHGTVEPWFLGKSNQSKGCIRMKNEDANELFKLVPYGTIVRIEQKNRIFRTLANGDVGSDVLEMQKALKKLGYYRGSPDGVFGDFLENRVRKFQKDNNLYQTGVINISTHDRVLENEKEHDRLKSK